MDDPVLYRFCVRAKVFPDQPEASRPAFITPYYLTEADAAERFEVLECLQHTAQPLSSVSYVFD